ncbi:hypothetical protein [Actinomadura rudentiformis]|uniref:hypothetical protein n=1 Tax=Actinomadura rudentiformis TaxID=359158 RepID=UPI00178C7189|nr:hypothetical protein [Actinomadura rudentiformis]
MNRDDVDRALQDLRDEKERISLALLDLEGHQGHRLLDGAAVTGETARRQAELQSRMTALWSLFDHYGGTLAAAEELRARHSRPGQAQLAELTRLLTGPSVELPTEEVPIERRTLLSTPTGKKLTLAQVVQRMTPLFEEAAQMVAAVDAVWSELLAALGQVEADRRAVHELAVSLGGPDPELDRLGRELDDLAAAVRTDPLSFEKGGHVDTSRLRAASTGLIELRRRLGEAAAFRADSDARIARAAAAVDQVREAEAAARQARDQVLIKIASPVLPDLADRSAALADRLAALPVLRDARRWSDLAERVGDLERAAATALQQARNDHALITGLLDRREELRGRLDAYRVKAARLGLAEDTELTRRYQEARELLWTSPCDLRKATVTLSGYQQAISSRAKGSNG